ncbi:hypothetical protein FB45DRAFT_873254 [Roridomyces roridus]|uniref:Uncharacterized protein n=1 Tax=Roridomyces roridus TaxID=1738132 RepID=A0AAD7BBG2_9AGAR|nr:hypothetical protein FB45DRAFT_873254 [Roridomyces roridus]
MSTQSITELLGFHAVAIECERAHSLAPSIGTSSVVQKSFWIREFHAARPRNELAPQLEVSLGRQPCPSTTGGFLAGETRKAGFAAQMELSRYRAEIKCNFIVVLAPAILSKLPNFEKSAPAYHPLACRKPPSPGAPESISLASTAANVKSKQCVTDEAEEAPCERCIKMKLHCEYISVEDERERGAEGPDQCSNSPAAAESSVAVGAAMEDQPSVDIPTTSAPRSLRRIAPRPPLNTETLSPLDGPGLAEWEQQHWASGTSAEVFLDYCEEPEQLLSDGFTSTNDYPDHTQVRAAAVQAEDGLNVRM